MKYQYKKVLSYVHRLIPSRFPPISLFDWADSNEELEQIAALEGMTNERLLSEYGEIHRVPPEDWVGGEGSTPLMAAFTHAGISRFSNGQYGIYYAGDSLETAISETKYHREKFLSASKEAPCAIQMREYIAQVNKPLVDISNKKYADLLHSDNYIPSQHFGQKIKADKEWGIYYPSVRYKRRHCVAIFRPPALTIPVQGIHLDYIWDGDQIIEIRKAVSLMTPA